MNFNKLGYSGRVTLKYKFKDKIVQVRKFNSGWSNLFKFLTLCLTDNMNSLSSSRPQYIDLRYETPTGEWVSCLSAKIPVTPSFNQFDDATVEDGINYMSVFTATLSESMINTVGASGIYALFLLSGEEVGANSTSNVLASLGVDSDSVANLSPGVQILIEWALMFNNYSDVN